MSAIAFLPARSQNSFVWNILPVTRLNPIFCRQNRATVVKTKILILGEGVPRTVTYSEHAVPV